MSVGLLYSVVYSDLLGRTLTVVSKKLISSWLTSWVNLMVGWMALRYSTNLFS